uniref:Ig-like domain-containing protein n=1 Tax=Gadus morhua TaxID=8049 RepID=A0A8C5FGC6_GADMO
MTTSNEGCMLSFFPVVKNVRLTVSSTDGEVVKVRSSVTDNVVKEGSQVTLTCTSACSFHQLDVHWYRNGHALSETGPALHLSSLTNNNTGNYTCSLDSSGQKTSAPLWSSQGEIAITTYEHKSPNGTERNSPKNVHSNVKVDV